MSDPLAPAAPFEPYRCFDPTNESQLYLGLQESTLRGITLLLHTYSYTCDDGTESVSYSAVGPRLNREDPEVLLPKAVQWSPMARSQHVVMSIPIECLCAHCSEVIPVGSQAQFVSGCGILHLTCFAVAE